MSFVDYLNERNYPQRPGRNAKPWVIAHRGYSAVAPENTLAAVDAALAIGADACEIDLALSADGTPLVLHDSTLDRTTTGRGPVARMDDDDLSRLDAGSWFGPGYVGQKVPRVETVLRQLGEREGTLLLEFKGDWEASALLLVADLVIEYGVADRVIAQSFSTTTVRRLRDVAPLLPRALLRNIPREEDFETVLELGAMAYNPSLRGFTMRSALVEQFREEGVGTFVWTVDEANSWEQLLGLGVDGIITNQPGRLQGYLSAKYDA